MTTFRVAELVGWARERHNIYERRFIQNLPAPWTEDPIMQQFKFCNAYRELDRVTIWIKKHWRDPYCDDPYLWFAMAVARFLNLPDSLGSIGYPAPWTRSMRNHVEITLKRRKAEGYQNFSGAYMVRSDPGDKIDYVLSVWDELWENLGPAGPSTLRYFYEQLIQVRGVGSFMAAQIIADMRHVAPLNKAKDILTWAASGPGSRRGLARVMGADRMERGDYRWDEADWFKNFHELHLQVLPAAEKVGLKPPHGQDLQGWLCEYDKWRRVKNGEGRPRSRYNGMGE